MTQALFLASRSSGLNGPVVDGVEAVAINLDSTSNTATVVAAAVAKLNAIAGKGDVYPSNYFDTVSTLSDLAAGPVNGNNKAMVFSNTAPVALA